MKPCIECGEPSADTRCPEHAQRDRTHDQKLKTSPEERGYDRAWRKLSERARKIQPWCVRCFTTADLQCDHTPRAWRRKAEGKSIRLRDVQVLCGPCNRAEGAARGERTRGDTPTETRATPPGEAKSPLHTPRGYAWLDRLEAVVLVGAALGFVRYREPSGWGEPKPIASSIEDRQDSALRVEVVSRLARIGRRDGVRIRHREVSHDRSLS